MGEGEWGLLRKRGNISLGRGKKLEPTTIPKKGNVDVGKKQSSETLVLEAGKFARSERNKVQTDWILIQRKKERVARAETEEKRRDRVKLKIQDPSALKKAKRRANNEKTKHNSESRQGAYSKT